MPIDPLLFPFLKGQKLHAEEMTGHPPHSRHVDEDRGRFVRNRQSQDQQHGVVNKHVAFYLASSDRKVADGAGPFGVACK